MAAVEELTDSRLYEHEARLFRRKVVDGDRVAAIFERFATEERLHHEILRGMATIDELGAAATSKPPFSDSLRESLRTHVERELRSIHALEELLKDREDPRQRITIKGIRADEKEHLETALRYLKALQSR